MAAVGTISITTPMPATGKTAEEALQTRRRGDT